MKIDEGPLDDGQAKNETISFEIEIELLSLGSYQYPQRDFNYKDERILTRKEKYPDEIISTNRKLTDEAEETHRAHFSGRTNRTKREYKRTTSSYDKMFFKYRISCLYFHMM